MLVIPSQRSRIASVLAACAPALMVTGAAINDASATPVVIPDATYQGNGGAGTNPIFPALTGPGTGVASFNGTGINTLPASASTNVSLSGSPVPTVGVTDSATNTFASGFGQITYFFEVVGGPATPTPVNVIVQAFAATTASGDGSAGATFALGLGTGGSFIAQWQACSPGTGTNPNTCGALPTGFTLNTSEALLSNTLYEVLLAAGGGVSTLPPIGPAGPGTGAMSALIDPSFEIDPSMPNASQFSFDFSAGIGNAVGLPPPPPGTSVSEPGMLALLGVAFTGIGFARRRKLH